MRVRTALVCVLSIAAVAGHGRLGAQDTRPSFHAGIELVSLNVAVLDHEQRLVPDLAPDDFVILDDGEPRPLVYFGRADIPLALALLLDTSGSMEGTLSTARAAAVDFTRELRPADLTGLFAFNSGVSVLHDFTRDRDALEAAIRRTTADGPTTFYTSVYIALRTLDRLDLDDASGAPRRRALVVLSDGLDNLGPLTFDDLIDAVARTDIVIYCIGLEPPPLAVGLHRDDGRYVLRELARQTGGRAFFVRDARELEDVHRRIHDELSSQYTLAYERVGPRDGRWRDVTVRVDRPGVTVRTRLGYFAPTH